MPNNIKEVNFFIGDIHVESHLDYEDVFLDKNKGFLQTFFQKELKQIEENILNGNLQRINVFLLGDIIMNDYDNMLFYYLEKKEKRDNKKLDQILEKTIDKYTYYLIKYNELFIKSMESLINTKIDNTLINYKIIFGNHDYIIPGNISNMWENIIIKSNESLPNLIRYEIIENKVISDNNRIIYGELNYPIYIDIYREYNKTKLDDQKYNTFLLDNALSKTKIIKNVIDNYFFNELSTLLYGNSKEFKIIDNRIIYEQIQKLLSNNISKHFSETILVNNIKKNNLISGILSLIDKSIKENNINLNNYPYLKNIIKNMEYIDIILKDNQHNIELNYQLNTFVIFIFTLIKNLFNILVLISFKKEKSIFENSEFDIDSFYYLSHFPFSLDDLKLIVGENNFECKKSSNYVKYKKGGLYYYFNKTGEHLLLLLELINIVENNNNFKFNNIFIYSGHTHNNIECNMKYNFYDIKYNIYSFGYIHENNYIKKF